MSQQGRLLLRVEALEVGHAEAGSAAIPRPAAGTVGLPIGSVAPNFTLPTLAGDPTALEALRALGKPVMLVFSDPGCGPCHALLPEIGRWQRDYDSKVVVALISRGTIEANRPKVTEHGLRHVLLQQDREVAAAYQASGTPMAVLIDGEGKIASELVAGAPGVMALAECHTSSLSAHTNH